MFTTPKLAREVFLFDPEKPRMMPMPPDLTYFVSATPWPMSNLIRLEPLTLSRLVRAIVGNLAYLTHYRTVRFLHVRLHAYKLAEGEAPWWGALKVVRFFKRGEDDGNVQAYQERSQGR